MNLIEEWLNDVDEYESPSSYWYWSFLTAIAATVSNRVYLDRFDVGHLYPNIYVFLFGKSGLRKGVPINKAKELVTRVANTRIISGRMSIQSLVEQLGKAYSREGQPPLVEATAFISASEFASSLVEDPQALTILTDLYDGHYYETNPWKNSLKSGGESLKRPNITMIGGINSPHFREAIQTNSIEGGFIGRTFIILETKKHRSNSLVDKPNRTLNLDYYETQLREIGKLTGPIAWSTPGKNLYRAWYHEIDKLEIDDNTGTIMRLGDHVLKVAMLIALADGAMELKEAYVESSIKVCSDFSSNATRVTTDNSKGTSQLSPVLKKIMEILHSNPEHRLSRRIILQKLYPDGVLSVEIDACTNTLVEMGFMQVERNGHDLYLSMDAVGLKAYESIFLKGKVKES